MGRTPEKVDGANSGIGWTDEGPLFRNRSKILRKAFDGRKDTPAKAQFKPVWNWMYQHEDDIREISKRFGSLITPYGEWMWAQHSLHYNALPDVFLAYDLWDVDRQRFLSPMLLHTLLQGLGIHYISPRAISWVDDVTIRSLLASDTSEYRTDAQGQFNQPCEGWVFKQVRYGDGDPYVTQMVKLVRPDFVRVDDGWNDRPLQRNVVVKQS